MVNEHVEKKDQITDIEFKDKRNSSLKGKYQKPQIIVLECNENVDGNCSDMASGVSHGGGLICVCCF